MRTCAADQRRRLQRQQQEQQERPLKEQNQLRQRLLFNRYAQFDKDAAAGIGTSSSAHKGSRKHILRLFTSSTSRDNTKTRHSSGESLFYGAFKQSYSTDQLDDNESHFKTNASATTIMPQTSVRKTSRRKSSIVDLINFRKYSRALIVPPFNLHKHVGASTTVSGSFPTANESLTHTFDAPQSSKRRYHVRQSIREPNDHNVAASQLTDVPARKYSGIASTIRATLRRSSLATLMLRNGGSTRVSTSEMTLSECQIEDNSANQRPIASTTSTTPAKCVWSNSNSPPAQVSPNITSESDAFTPNSPSLSTDRQSLYRFYDHVEDSTRSGSEKKLSNASSSVKRTMRKRFSTAKVALRKLSLSSISMTHGSNPRLPSCSASALASPLGSSATASPVKSFPYFFDQNGVLVVVTADENGFHQRSSGTTDKSGWRSSKTSRVFRKKSATSPTSKRSLGPSLSWDPEQRSRSPSLNSRSRVHSDGSNDSRNIVDMAAVEASANNNNLKDRRTRKKSCANDSGIYERLALVHSCLHCLFDAEYRRNQLRSEIETAVQRLSKRLNSYSANGSSVTARATIERRNSPSMNFSNVSSADSLTSGSITYDLHQRIGTPDIVVSSFSSGDEFQDSNCTSSLDRLSLKGDTSELGTARTSREVKNSLGLAVSGSYSSAQSPREVTIFQDIIISQEGLNKQIGSTSFMVESNAAFDSIKAVEKRSGRPPPLQNVKAGLIQGDDSEKITNSPLLTPTNASTLSAQSISPLSATSSTTLSPKNTSNNISHSSSRFTYSDGDLTATTTPTTTPNFQLLSGSATTTADASSHLLTDAKANNDANIETELAKQIGSHINMDTLKLPAYYMPITFQTVNEDSNAGEMSEQVVLGASLLGAVYGTNSSPPRSSSIDLSTLRRDIELWSIRSLETASSGNEMNQAIRVSSASEDRHFVDVSANVQTSGSADSNADDDSITTGYLLRRETAEKTLRVNNGGKPPPASPVDAVSAASLMLGARTSRSRSHDPTECPEHVLRRSSRIEHLSEIFRKALAKSPVVKRAAAIQEHEQRRVSKHQTSRYWLDEQLKPAEHIWLPSSGAGNSNSNDTECYIGENNCEKIGEKRRCAACHIVAHTACFPVLAKMNLICKTTFYDCSATKHHAGSKEAANDVLTRHHWIHRWKLEGRCQHCSKSFQQKMFRDKEVIAITCSWCKKSYHNKRSCFSTARFDERCDRGTLGDLILPPSWLLRLSNHRKRHSKSAFTSATKKLRRKYRPFIVKPIDHSGDILKMPCMPLLVFVNPKSGGNKGHKALNTLCWLLNPRQVFDITALKGPKYGLEVFRKVATQLRILVAGGDGTVGWVLSTLDQLNWPSYPPIALVPLGTGNDLSRSMGWGGVFSDEPLSEILSALLHETSITYLDRWRLDVQPNTNVSAGNVVGDADNEHVPTASLQSSLPLTVMNNYFSIGADAHVALQFHHSRSANPQMLNSRLKNRLAYGGLGTIDLFKRTWKDLSEYMTLECDDVDITWKIREMKVHCVLFHNINYYAGGTMPWGDGADSGEYAKPSACDGRIEVLGFTTATLAALQMGGKGQIIEQCSKIRITTTKPIPMQVDGEPCLLAPSHIRLSFHNKVPMLRREKNAVCASTLNFRRCSRTTTMDHATASTSVVMHVPVIVVGRHDFDTYRDSIERLRDTGFELGVIGVDAEMELLQARTLIQRLISEHSMLPYEPKKEWRFIDYVSSAEEGIFRVSRHAERSNAISDICNLDECILILDDAFPSMTNRSAAIAFAPAASPLKPMTTPPK